MVELIFFWLPLILVIHSYLLYPLILHLAALGRSNNRLTYNQNDNLPNVSILLSVYNEEKHIEQRIRNIYATSYPVHKIEVIVGSDNSIDATNNILQQLQKEYTTLKVFQFHERAGKPNTLNQIIDETQNEILIFTDAKVLFSPQAIFQLVKHFINPQIGIVGGNIVNKKLSPDGISVPEKTFMSNEIRTKYNEGILWGATIGTYGACYAIRKELFMKLPEGLVVDDFFENMHVLKSGKKAIMEVNALCFEEVPNDLQVEFNRKIRISVGNFQNLNHFGHLLLKCNPVSFCFFSHKIIRWIGPFLLYLILLSNIFLLYKNDLYFYSLAVQLIVLSLPIFDFFLRNIRVDILILRFVTHFYLMNIALGIGFIKYIKRVKTNVWEPTKR
jgi:cellulose synthase/poly-beta-1,6-N-acetylglucosamine synthase-like glycosyltransferase